MEERERDRGVIWKKRRGWGNKVGEKREKKLTLFAQEV